MCQTADYFTTVFNYRMNLWVAKNRRPFPNWPKFCNIPDVPDNSVVIQIPALRQRLIPGGGPWGFDGLEWITPAQTALMDSILDFLENIGLDCSFGRYKEDFFIVLHGTKKDEMLFERVAIHKLTSSG